MSTLIYGPEAFVVGADIALETYDSNWVKITAPGGAQMTVQAATDDVRSGDVATSGFYRWDGAVPAAQRVEADILPGSGYPGLSVRMSGSDGYTAEWDTSGGAGGDIVLYRVTGGTTPVYTEIARGCSVDSGTFVTNCYLKATGTNPVQLEAGDDVNGATRVTYSDSAGNRHQTGQPGIQLYNNAAGLAVAIDNIKIYDETPGGGSAPMFRGS